MSVLFLEVTSPSAAETMVHTPTSSRWSGEDNAGSPSVVIKNTFIDGFEMPLGSPAQPRRARSCPCDRTPRCSSGSTVEGIGAEEIGLEAACGAAKDGETCSENASTRADEFVVSTPLDTPRSSCTQTSDRTLDSTPTRQSVSVGDLQPVVVRLFDHVPSETNCQPVHDVASSHGLGCGLPEVSSPAAVRSVVPWSGGFSDASRNVPPPPSSQPALGSAFSAVQMPPPPPSQVAPGSASLPSVGSAKHASGFCKPCAFLYTKGCANGPSCTFCHLCMPDERKFRLREKKAMAQRRAIVKARAAMQLSR